MGLSVRRRTARFNLIQGQVLDELRYLIAVEAAGIFCAIGDTLFQKIFRLLLAGLPGVIR